MSAGNFQSFLDLEVGENSIQAEVFYLSKTFLDSILIYRDSTKYFQPATPENVQIEISGNDAILNWSPVNSTIYGNHLIIDGYNLYFYPEPDGTFNQINATVIPDTSFVHPNIGNIEVRGFYQVTAVKKQNRFAICLSALSETSPKDILTNKIRKVLKFYWKRRADVQSVIKKKKLS